MPDGFTIVSVIVGFALVTAAGAKLGAGSLEGLFAMHGVRDWPTGVQEDDAPRFVFTPRSAVTSHVDDAPPWEIDELYAGPIRALRRIGNDGLETRKI
jgi:hypothetical protein